MRFSVIIPCWNQVQYLPEAITSVKNQTYTDFEVIVVNDGSPDATQEVAEFYKTIFEINRIPFKLISQANKGLASARNAGIMNATGGYILPLDADDILFDTCLERISQIVDETDADVIGPSIRCFNDGTDVYQDTTLKENPIFDDFKEGNRLAYCSAIKREALLEVGGYSPKMDVLGGWEDLWMWYALIKRGKKIVTIQEPLVMYRIKEKSMSKDAEKNKEALWAQIIKDFPETKEHAKF